MTSLKRLLLLFSRMYPPKPVPCILDCFPGEPSIADILDNNKAVRDHVENLMQKTGKPSGHAIWDYFI